MAADDRTGALEVAGACADAARVPVLVHVGDGACATPSADDAAIVVVDVATRHLAAVTAGAVAAEVDAAMRTDGAGRSATAHKIDSTLRGNWAHELVARHRASGRRVLVVPAFPAVGRQCVRGVVIVDGVPVAESAAASDVRGPVASSRPADLLRAAGADQVREVAPGGSLDAWWSAGESFAVCDAATDDDLRLVAAGWAAHSTDVLFAGTAGSIGAAAGALRRAHVRADGPIVRPGSETSLVRLPALVVCGSLHPVARAQVRSLRAANDERLTVLASPEPVERPVPHDAAVAAAEALARSANVAIDDGSYRTVVIIGGDTAAAILGDASVMVGGTVAAGMPWFRLAANDGPLFITKAGGFGGPDALTDLLLGTAGERTTR